MQRKLFMRRTSVIAGLALGLVFGPITHGGIASAQSHIASDAGTVITLAGTNGGGRGGRHLSTVKQAIFTAGAQAVNLTTTELRTRLRNGQTIAQIAQAQGTTEQAVLTAALAAARTELNRLVAAGSLTQARADAYYTQLQQRGAAIFNDYGRSRGRR